VNRPVLSLLLLSFFTFVLGLGRPAITDSDEGYYAEASREMVESSDWLTPRFNYDNRFEKPALYYWLTAATYVITGPTEGAARFWSAMSGVGLVVLAWAIAGGRGRPNVSWLAGAIVATSFGCFTMARWALPDLPLTFFITLGIWAAIRASDATDTDLAVDARRVWWSVAGMSAGLGFLMKGPVALAVPAVVLIPLWWKARRSVRLDPGGVALAALLFAVSGLPWYILMWREHGAAYLDSFFVGDNVERFTTSRFNDARPVWYYLAVLLGGMLPWSIYLSTFACGWVLDRVRQPFRLTESHWRLLIWAVMPLLFYTASIGKQPRYILPVLIPIAILLAQAFATRIEAAPTDAGRSPGRSAAATVSRQPGLIGASWGTAILLLIVSILFLRLRPLFITSDPSFTIAAVGVTAGAAIAFAWLAASHSWRRLPAVGAVAAAAVLLALQFGALSGRRPEPVEEMAALVRAHRTANESVCIYNVFTRNLTFYSGIRVVQAFDITQAAGLARSPERVLFVARADHIRAIEAVSGAPLTTLGRVQYVNTANLRIRTILQPDPTVEIADILLVANR
jgi:4-amino-4-deoxy-L-arabinose transferase-like glycosyltransferase